MFPGMIHLISDRKKDRKDIVSFEIFPKSADSAEKNMDS
jgi:hypothetical protein